MAWGVGVECITMYNYYDYHLGNNFDSNFRVDIKKFKCQKFRMCINVFYRLSKVSDVVTAFVSFMILTFQNPMFII